MPSLNKGLQCMQRTTNTPAGSAHTTPDSTLEPFQPRQTQTRHHQQPCRGTPGACALHITTHTSECGLDPRHALSRTQQQQDAKGDQDPLVKVAGSCQLSFACMSWGHHDSQLLYCPPVSAAGLGSPKLLARSCILLFMPAAQHSTAQHSTAQHSGVSTTQHGTAQHSMAQWCQHSMICCVQNSKATLHMAPSGMALLWRAALNKSQCYKGREHLSSSRRCSRVRH
jgi:hypothetical protein